MKIESIANTQALVKAGIALITAAVFCSAGQAQDTNVASSYLAANGNAAYSFIQAQPPTFSKQSFASARLCLNSGATLNMADGTRHKLFKDFCGSGSSGRYSATVYAGPGGSPTSLGADHNVFRREAIRQGITAS